MRSYVTCAVWRSLNAAAGQDDRALLERFIRQRDEIAFAVLMRRHGGLVLRVCRGVLRHEHDAEDAFQATFLILAKKARAIRKQESLASWLFGVARRTALKAKQAAQRRRRQQPPDPAPPPEQPVSTAALRELQAILDDEVERLPEKHRAAFVLCCVAGKSRAEAARELGWKEGTLSARLAQARDRLRQRLGRRGFSFSAALAAAALITGTAPATVPAILLQSASRAAVLFAAGKIAPGVSSQTLTLTEGVLKAMFLTKVKIVTGVLLALAVVGAGLGTSSILQQTQAADAIDAPNAGQAARPTKDNPSAELKRLTDTVKTAFDWGQYAKFHKLHEGHAENGHVIIAATKCTACHVHPFTHEKRDSDRWRIVSVAEDREKGSDYVLVVLKRQRPKGDDKERKGQKKPGIP